MPYKQPESVLVVIYTPQLEVLLIERAAHPGYWQSVTGSREGTEALSDTAWREVREETGLDIPREQILPWGITNRFEILEQWRHRYAPGVTHNLEHVFSLCLPHPVEVRLAPDEHRDQCWQPWQEAAAQCFSWSNQDAILMLPHRPQQPSP
ncbi:dihydroneopterin triphosphate diphosphatase [Candidatus Dactylopiibacterium carminicum]|uniref:dihydroneopterin triphosphate diphosphatase n=1 Tax=Candidatus Dactylopiibacterium carminicum TaxID=857335 RepID=UPI001CC2A7B9|nr:dihydroneopterin triphosphate diphosphatase [Candidatus Dactylopiibacterium carminicum]